MATGQKLSGINPLAYLGVEPSAPSQVVLQERQPTPNDYHDYNVGTWWLMVTAQEVWILISKLSGIATWIQLFPGAGGGASVFITDAGTANEAGNEIRILGGTNIGTTALGNAVTVNLNPSLNLAGNLGVAGFVVTDGGILAGDTLTVASGATRLLPLSALGVVQTQADGTLFTNAGTNGQLLIGSSGAAPAWASLTSPNNTISIVAGANSIELEATGGAGTVSFLANLSSQEIFPVIGTNFVGSVVVWTPVFNVGSHFFPGDGAGAGASFTAPTTDQYAFNVNFKATVGSANILGNVLTQIQVTGPGGAQTYSTNAIGAEGSDYQPRDVTQSIDILLALTANDVVRFAIFTSRTNIRIESASGGGFVSWISGHRI